MDVEGQGLNSYSKEQDIYTFDTAEDPFGHIIYDFDFEDNKIDGVNWIESRNNTADRYVVADGIELGAITISKHGSLPADHKQSIKVEMDPTGADNKVLALKAGYATGTAKTDPDPSYLTGWVTQIRFNANGKTGLSRSTDMGKGKKLVYKTKIFVPSDFLPTESSQLVNTASETQATANSTSGIGGTMAGSFYAATTGSWGSPMARSWVYNSKASGGNYSVHNQWVEWKHVADVSKPLSATHSDTVRAYVNDKLITSRFTRSNDASAANRVFGYNGEIHEMTEMAAIDFGQMAISNQPSFHLPFLFAALGDQEKTNYWVKRLALETFSSGNDGYPGDEDNGTTASWYIFAVLGLYPTCPGKPEFTVSGAIVKSAKLKTVNGKINLVKKIKDTNTRYPRAYSKIKSKPL